VTKTFADFVKAFSIELSIRVNEIAYCDFDKILGETYVHHFAPSPKLNPEQIEQLRRLHAEQRHIALAKKSSAKRYPQAPEANQ
jgi:hypothetical protein